MISSANNVAFANPSFFGTSCTGVSLNHNLHFTEHCFLHFDLNCNQDCTIQYNLYHKQHRNLHCNLHGNQHINIVTKIT